ncbi:MAG TPA: YjbE family putative metal transport protein [Ktedonobacterales bacterium]
MLEALSAIAGIVLVDLTLSGDNALVIGAAASGLPAKQRRIAILLGGGGAIVLRILFAILATLLLQLPLLQAAGGLLLLVIAARLLAGRDAHAPSGEGAAQPSNAQRGLIGALVTITLADVTMSLDNILAIGALAAGHIPLLVVGLLLSIALVLAGAALVAELIRRLPWLLDLAALVLGWTAAGMLLEDAQVGPLLHALPSGQVLVYAAALLVVIAADVVLRLRARRARKHEGEGGSKEKGMGERREPDRETDTVPHAHE